MSKGEETRNRIIEQAAPLFNKYGMAGVSISDIMSVTDLQKGGIYRHFDSKEEIALAAFDHNYREITHCIMEGISEVSDHQQRLIVFLRNFICVPTQIEGGCPVLNTAIEHDDGNDTLRKRAQQAIDEWQNILQHIMKDGVADGAFRQNLNIESVTTLYIAALEGSVMLSRIHSEENRIKQVIEQLLEHAKNHVFTPN